MAYTRYFLISELQRFHRENGRIPTALDMQPKFGYPSYKTYVNHFGRWNNALIEAELEVNQKRHIGTLDGTEVCCYCGKRADEIPNFTHWYYHNGIRYCNKHGRGSDYVIGKLDINSNTGLGRAGEILVAKTLGIEKEHDCNRISCGYKFDLYHDEYGKIDVKTSLYSYEYNRWKFGFNAKKNAKTYICIGLSSDRKTVEHVWVVPNVGKIKDLAKLTIYDTQRSLSINEKWKVDPRPYNNTWKSMSLNSCKIMTDKNKPKVTRTWKETLNTLAELNEKYGTKHNL